MMQHRLVVMWVLSAGSLIACGDRTPPASDQPDAGPLGRPDARTVPTGDSALAMLADSMSPGEWADLSMGGLDSPLVEAAGPSVHSLLTYAARGVWDPLHKQIQFAGTSHTGGQHIAGAGGLMTWDDATNQWSKETYTWSSEAPGHAYYHLAINDSSGDLYFRDYNSQQILRRTYGATGQGSWESAQVANHPDAASQVAGGLQWFPELNGNAGGLVFVDAVGAAWSNASASAWTQQSGESLSGGYHNWIAHAGACVYWGGGNGSTAMYRLDTTGIVTTMPTTPMEAGSNTNAAIVLAHPNGTDLMLFQVTANGAVHRFDGTSWSTAGAHQIDSAGVWIGVPIHDYGVIVFIVHPGATGAPYARVFKP